MLVLLLLLTACIPEAEAVHWYIWARDVWFRSPPLSLIKNGTTFHYPSQVLWLSQVQTDAQVRSVIVAEMWDAQGFEQIMHAWFLGFGTLALSVPWLFVLITSQWLLKVATLVILLHAFEKGAHQQMLSGVGPIPRRCHCAWCLLGAGLGVNLNYVSCDVMHICNMQYIAIDYLILLIMSGIIFPFSILLKFYKRAQSCIWFIMFYLRVSLLFVTPCKCSTTHVTLKRFLPCNVYRMMLVFSKHVISTLQIAKRTHLCLYTSTYTLTLQKLAKQQDSTWHWPRWWPRWARWGWYLYVSLCGWWGGLTDWTLGDRSDTGRAFGLGTLDMFIYI